MRDIHRFFVLTLSIISLQLVACGSSFTTETPVENQGSPPTQQADNSNEQGPKADEAKRLQATLGDPQTGALLSTGFEGLFEPDGQYISPNYLVADFNGDGVLDIAIPARLRQSFAPSDTRVSPFWFGKPPGPGITEEDEKYRFRTADLARYRSESILIVIHGMPERGWNHSEPKQRFVIVDGWDAGGIHMESYRGNLKPSAAGDGAIESPPRLLGDAILMLGPESKGTALYWDGRWYPVEPAR